MNIEEIIRAWKAEKLEASDQHLPENPVGNELSDAELAEAVGGQWNGEQEYANALIHTLSPGCSRVPPCVVITEHCPRK